MLHKERSPENRIQIISDYLHLSELNATMRNNLLMNPNEGTVEDSTLAYWEKTFQVHARHAQYFHFPDHLISSLLLKSKSKDEIKEQQEEMQFSRELYKKPTEKFKVFYFYTKISSLMNRVAKHKKQLDIDLESAQQIDPSPDGGVVKKTTIDALLIQYKRKSFTCAILGSIVKSSCVATYDSLLNEKLSKIVDIKFMGCKNCRDTKIWNSVEIEDFFGISLEKQKMMPHVTRDSETFFTFADLYYVFERLSSKRPRSLTSLDPKDIELGEIQKLKITHPKKYLSLMKKNDIIPFFSIKVINFQIFRDKKMTKEDIERSEFWKKADIENYNKYLTEVKNLSFTVLMPYLNKNTINLLLGYLEDFLLKELSIPEALNLDDNAEILPTDEFYVSFQNVRSKLAADSREDSQLDTGLESQRSLLLSYHSRLKLDDLYEAFHPSIKCSPS